MTLAVLGATIAMPASAQYATPNWYLGGNIGRAQADFDHAPMILVPPAAVSTIGDSDRDTAWKLYGGYQFNSTFAIEGGYFDLGDYNYFYTTPGGAFNGTSRFRGLNLDLVASTPVYNRFSAFARVGAVYSRARANFASTGTVPVNGSSGNENSFGAKVGLGIQYAITDALSVRAELERYRLRDPVRSRGNIDMASVGLVYRFGAAPTPVRVVAPPPPPPPAYVPPPPPPPRVMAPPPPPPPPPVYVPPPPPPPPPAPAPVAPRPYRN